MKRPLSDRLAPAAFIASVAVLSVLYGVVSSWWGWFPAPQIGLAHRTMLDIGHNWRNDLALEPTRHLVEPSDATRAVETGGYRAPRPAAAQPGYTLIAGISPDQDAAAHMATLYDSAGRVVHRWPVRYGALDPDGRAPLNVLLHGLEVFPDGSLAVTFDAGNAIARIDACGKPLWTVTRPFHHSIESDGEGGLFSWRGEIIARLDAETGAETFTLDLREEIVPAAAGEQRGYFDIRTHTVGPEAEHEAPVLPYLTDPFHPNDVEPLRAGMAEAFPMFEPGDLLISLRELNMIAVIDPATGRLRWWRHGPWMKQHDPDFQPDGTITVYDNATGTGVSKIRRVDPVTGTVETLFSGSESLPFYSWRRGKHQILENGNLLLTEPEHGRVLEVTPAGELVWEREMIWNATDNLIVTEARHLPADFFSGGVPSCAGDAAIARARQ